MTKFLSKTLIVSAALFLAVSIAHADAEIVIAIRYLQAQGTSHSHLYLYREDGKLLRQLTNDNSGQDVAPMFAPDGETIVFTREAQSVEFWTVQPRGGGLKKLDAAPEWYRQTKSSPYFTNADPTPQPTASASSGASPVAEPPATPEETATPTPHYTSPDGAFELVLQEDPKDEDDQVNMPGHGKHYLLRDLKTGKETAFGDIKDFFGAFELLHQRDDREHVFCYEGTLRLAFFDVHLNSTDGTTVLALDLRVPRFVRLSPNWATPVPLPGEAAFMTLTENRYVPIPGTNKTANCSYLERWDEHLNHLRYVRQKTAALCYGFSMFRPGANPPVVTLRGTSRGED